MLEPLYLFRQAPKKLRFDGSRSGFRKLLAGSFGDYTYRTRRYFFSYTRVSATVQNLGTHQ